MKRLFVIYLAFQAFFGMMQSCTTENMIPDSAALKQSALDIAQTSGQLASGTSFQITGSSTDSTGSSGMLGGGMHRGKHGAGGPGGHGKHKGILDGLRLLAPTEELLAIVDAETAGDIRGLRIAARGGATVTHYDAAGAVVTLPLEGDGPQGCSFSGKQFPKSDSLLATIVKTEIDYGSGSTFKRDSITITRSGKITITRSGDKSNHTEVITFENYLVNGYQIQGTKTRVSTFDSATGSGTSNTSVANGKIIFPDGSVTSWASTKSRVSDITLNDSGKPASGTITTQVNSSVTLSDGTVIYSHKTTAPLVENLACEGRRHGPVSGVLETIYRDDTVVVDYGDGTCGNTTISISLNGVTTTKTIGE